MLSEELSEDEPLLHAPGGLQVQAVQRDGHGAQEHVLLQYKKLCHLG